MDFSPRSKYIIEQIKANFKFLLVGLAILTLFAIGSVLAITLIAIIVIAVPIVRLLRARKAKGFKKNQHDIDDFIDVDYEIVGGKGKKKG